MIGFAALPKLGSSDPAEGSSSAPVSTAPTVSKSTEDLLAQVKLPPRPDEIPEDYEMEALEKQFQHLQDTEDDNGSDTASISDSVTLPTRSAHSSITSVNANKADTDVKRLHHNLESRLQPFWSTTLPNRVVRLSLFASKRDPAYTSSPSHPAKPDKEGLDHGPVYTQDILTTADGSFTHRFTVPWADLCTHAGALHIAFGDVCLEHELLALAELLPPVPLQQAQLEIAPVRGATAHAQAIIPLTNAPVRLISDIDDTVKMSNILRYIRFVFYDGFWLKMRYSAVPVLYSTTCSSRCL